MSLEAALAEWEVKGNSRNDLTPDYLSFRMAQDELEAATGDWPGTGYKRDLNWQMDFWREWFAVCRGINADATRICVREINNLRGR